MSVNEQNLWPHRLARSRTPGSHPGNAGSNPAGATAYTTGFEPEKGGGKTFVFPWWKY